MNDTPNDIQSMLPPLSATDHACALERINQEYNVPSETMKRAIAFLRSISARPAFDVEAMLKACVPPGWSCDPQQVADAIRDWFATAAMELPEPASRASASVTDDMRNAVRWAPSSAYWSTRLIEFFGPDARDGINALEKQLREARASASATLELPALPEPAGVIIVGTQAMRAFTADQMHTYGEACRASASATAPNLACKSVQKRLATQWGYVPASAAAVGEWQPIETAPRDGTLFIGWVAAERWSSIDGEGSGRAHDTSQVDFCWWRRAPEAVFGGYFDNASGRIGDGQDITHWMPLPTPPSAQQEGGAK